MEREMNPSELKISPNTTGEYSSDNPAIRFVRSRFGAMLLLFVSLLYPFESFSANCQLKAAPICLDASPYQDTIAPDGTPMRVYLSTADAPAGAMVTTASCWKYKSVYDCVQTTSPTYSDTCKKVKDGGDCVNYTEKSVTCNPGIPLLAGGACAMFDVAYQCEIAPGQTYAETTCGTTPACTDADGNPTFCTGPISQEKNESFGLMVAGTEATRQAGVYLDSGDNPGETDLSKISIFKGEAARCSEGMWGAAPNCCNPISKGADAKNAIVAQEVLGAAWNQIAVRTVGSEYMYDSLLTKTVDLIGKGLNAIRDAYNAATSSVPVVMEAANQAANVGSNVNAAASGTGSLSNAAAGIGGYIGGQAGGAAGTYVANRVGANTGWSGTLSALGTAAGTYAGTYVGAYAANVVSAFAAAPAGGGMAAASSAAATGGTAGTAATTAASATVIGLVIVLVIMIIMSFAACSPEDMMTQLKLGAPGICHYVGTYCNTHDFAGGCITTMQQYCCFNSRLAKIIQEGAKEQLPGLGGWGTPEAPNCAGMKVSELTAVDFSKIDMTEFVADVTVRAIPTGADQADRVQTMAQQFMAANQIDPTATDGLLITEGARQLPALDPIPAGDPPLTVPAMMPCTVASKVTGIAQDGSETGQFIVSQCNPEATIVWSNVGNCAAIPPTSIDPASASYVSSTVDANGTATFNVDLPASCLKATTPSTKNLWKGKVTLQPYGVIGDIDAIW
jgi:hypothetical protein